MGLCLTCVYEPDWGEPVGVEYQRRVGKCKYIVDFPPLPYVCRVNTVSLTVYDDDSGLPISCKTYIKKRAKLRTSTPK